MYQRGALNATSLQTLAESLTVELDKLARGAAQPSDYLSLVTLYAQPSRIFDGMIVKADGTSWNPGSGAGIYARVGTTWKFLG